MRGWWVLTVLALAGCGENQGWNPNYQFENDDYGRYRTTREAALVTGADPARTIPIARPILTPTAARIAGQDPVPVPPSMGLRILRPAATPAPTPASPAPTATRPAPGDPITITPPDMSL